MGRITIGYGQRRSVYGHTKAETLKKMRDEIRRAEDGMPSPDGRTTVATFLREWLDGPAKARLKASSFRTYFANVEQHIIPEIGSHRLTKLRPEHVDVLLARKQAAGLSPRSIQYMRAILRSALAWAEKRGRVARNVAALSDAPRVVRQEIHPLTPEQARTLVAACQGHPLGALIVTALDTGIRQGEALGLRWSDVDFERHELRVAQALQRINGAPQFDEPKSATSRRTVALTTLTAGFLRELRTRQKAMRLKAGPEWQDTDLVFTSEIGAPLVGSTVTHQFQRLLVDSGLPRQRFHDLRHASASFLLAQGVGIKAVSERLGHSQITLTLSTYAHIADEIQKDAASRMDALLRGVK
ncbi:MAG: site-specific integrase [Dehalococcoidia bacterium]